MASSDNVNIVTRERPASSDINNLQSMIQRNILEIFQYGMATNVAGAPSSSSPANIVLGGLEVIPNGNDVSVQPGALMMYSASLSPTPGALDSSYRLGVKRIATTVVMPSPVSTSYVVVEARVVNVVTSAENRDVFDAVTGQYNATLVNKLQERQLEYQATAVGVGTIPAYTGGDWIPIAIVRRPGGGGAVANSDIYDVRQLFSERVAGGGFTKVAAKKRRIKSVYQTASVNSGAASEDVVIWNMEGYATNGVKLSFPDNGQVTLNMAATAIKEDSLSLSANTWYYMYLCPFRGGTIRNALGTLSVDGNCLLVLSAVTPDISNGDTNDAAITPAAPFNTSPAIPAGTAVLVGALRRNSTNNGWVALRTSDGVHYVIPSVSLAGGTLSSLVSPPSAGDNAVTDKAPVGVTEAIYAIAFTGVSGTGNHVITPQKSSSTIEIDLSNTVVGTTDNPKFLVRVPVAAVGGGFDLNFAGGTIGGASVLTTQLYGFSY